MNTSRIIALIIMGIFTVILIYCIWKGLRIQRHDERREDDKLRIES
ncbi:MAG: hypothetical protein J5545_00610 [Bacteroidaceae bacterium]|nr:hypothetical protein [Bacteroidaceae bacterium]